MAKIQFKFNPFQKTGIKVPEEDRDDALDEVADFLKEAVLDSVAQARSPVYGTKWKGLSSEYKKRKAEESSSTTANLELTGEMLDHFDVVVQSGGKLSVEVSGDRDAVNKARGHNQHSGDEHPFLPVRRFIPEPSEFFTSTIENGIKRILKGYEK